MKKTIILVVAVLISFGASAQHKSKKETKEYEQYVSSGQQYEDWTSLKMTISMIRDELGIIASYDAKVAAELDPDFEGVASFITKFKPETHKNYLKTKESTMKMLVSCQQLKEKLHGQKAAQ